jgi:hypothetical protein
VHDFGTQKTRTNEGIRGKNFQTANYLQKTILQKASYFEVWALFTHFNSPGCSNPRQQQRKTIDFGLHANVSGFRPQPKLFEHFSLYFPILKIYLFIYRY